MGLIKKVIFLDIDGVLNSAQNAEMFHRLNEIAGKTEWRPYDDFCPVAISNLCSILESSPDIKIVLSSTWRLGCDTLDKLQNIFRGVLKPDALGMLIADRMIDRTPQYRDKERGIEIQAWLDINKAKLDADFHFTILDDDSDMAHLRAYLVRTDAHNGLTWTEQRKAIQMLQTGFETGLEQAEEACKKLYRETWRMTVHHDINKKVEEIRALLKDLTNKDKYTKE